MASHRRRGARRRYRVLVAGLVAAAGLSATTAGVYAGLNATASNSQSITSGTLKLTLSDNGAGFTQAISGLAPGDVVNRYVDLANNGSLNGKDLTLAISGGTTKLTTDATNGLTVSITSCSVAWTPATGVCSSGVTSAVLAATPVATMTSASPATVVSGALTAATTWHFKVSLQLPDQSETTVDGTLPTGTIQGLTDSVTYTFGESQRAATTTNS